MRTVNYHAHRVTAIVVLDMYEPLCISADSGGYIYVWTLDPQPGQEPLKNWREHSDWRYSGVHSLALSGLDVLYSGSGDKSIKAWSLKVILDYGSYSVEWRNFLFCLVPKGHLGSASSFTRSVQCMIIDY